jgi:hypothetical protein
MLVFNYYLFILARSTFYFFMAHTFCNFATVPAVVLKGNHIKLQGNRDRAWSRRGESIQAKIYDAANLLIGVMGVCGSVCVCVGGC